ncbi:hypothetical protein PTKIN_Ptkin13bG0095700 [Pterospermum kingtungense]
MGLLHKLWDETLAGPMPESGLGKLRKYDTFSATRPSPSPVVDTNNDNVIISRSITILKSNSGFRNLSVEPVLAPDSPSGSSAPGTPLTPGTPRGDFRRFTRRNSTAEAFDESAEHRIRS